MKAFLPALTILIFFSCATDEYDAEREALFNAKTKWISAKKSNSNNYSFKSRLSCECAYTENYTIIVKADKIASVQEITTGKFLAEQEFQYFSTIDQWFDCIDKSLKREPYKCSIKYDQTYGYPMEINFDFDERMIDEELYQRNDSLQFLK